MLDCLIMGLFRSIRKMKRISGHDYELTYRGVDVEVLTCKRYGKTSIGWW